MINETSATTAVTDLVAYDLCFDDNGFSFSSHIEKALTEAKIERQAIETRLNETLQTIKDLTPTCDKLDYALAASSGALCGILDLFLLGKPGESLFSKITDSWFEEKTKLFAKKWGWKGDGDTPSAIRFLEKEFKVPYDQNGLGEASKELLGVNPANHHFKSLAHNPTLLGLFFSILDQFILSSHFVSNNELITLHNVNNGFELRGNNPASKLFAGFANWIGHLISDASGSSGGKGRGAGIPSPLFSWSNDVIAIKRKLGLEANSVDKYFSQLSLDLYCKGYDARYQSAQAIPVLINETIVRLFYMCRRMIRYFVDCPKEERSYTRFWKSCEPFKNVNVKRMLTVAHGVFCLLDIGDAAIRGVATLSPTEFFLRLNILGVGRLSISLYGEAKRTIRKSGAEEEAHLLQGEKRLLDSYIFELEEMSKQDDAANIKLLCDDLKNSELYKASFQESARIADSMGIDKDKILRDKADIDAYFRRK